MFYIRRATYVIFISVSFLLLNFSVQAISPSDLVISKVQITGGTGKTSNDYIAIYNKTNSAVDLSGLRLVKRTKTGTTDTTIKSWVSSVLLNPGEYHLWANSADGFSSLLNANSESTQTISDDNGIALRAGTENTGTIIDSFAWGAASNAFVETSPYSTNHLGGEHYERINNQDTNNNSLDWQIIGPIINPICGNNVLETGEACDDGNTISNDGCSGVCQLETSQSICGNNILETVETCDDGNQLSEDGCSAICQIENIVVSTGDIRINELVADPNSGDEWIELYNTSTKNIELNNWTIEDGSGTKTILSGTIDKFFVITKPRGALNNSGDIIILKNSDGDIIDSITYGDWDDGDLTNNAEAATKPNSLARIHDGESTNSDYNDFKITTTPTKGSTNLITEEQEEENNTKTKTSYDYNQDIIFSEIFPNPVGLDNQAKNKEFIELYNQGDKNALLKGWRLEINDVIFLIDNDLIIYPKQYLIIDTNNSLPLPNDGATIKIFQPLKQTSFKSLTYKKAKEGQSYANFLTSSWQWTSKPTPGELNALITLPKPSFDLIDEPIINQLINFDSSDSLLNSQIASYNWNFGDGQTSNLSNPSHIFTKTGKHTITLTIKTETGATTISKTINILKNNDLNISDSNNENIDNNFVETSLKPVSTNETNASTTKPQLINNSLITITGIAVVEPNILGAQYFYFLPSYGEPLYQIYNSKKLFPKIKIGDQLSISGEYQEKETGIQLKTKSASDIKIIGQAKLPDIDLSNSNDLKNPPYPRLVTIKGEVVSKKSPRIYLTDEQGEIQIYLSPKAKIKTSDFEIGEKVYVTGILTNANGETKLQPRSIDDIKRITETDVGVAQFETKTEKPATSTLELNKEKTTPKKVTQLYYLIVLGLIIFSASIYFIYKK